MATSATYLRIKLFVIFLITINFIPASSQMSNELYPPMKQDIPFVKCDVCQKAMKYIYNKANSMRQDKEWAKIGESEFQDLVEKACNPDQSEGEWLAKLDIEEKDGELKVLEQKDLGSCKAECRTVAKACDETVGDADVDIAEELWKEKLSLSQLIKEVCYTKAKACSKNKMKYKPGSRKNEKFERKSEDKKNANGANKMKSKIARMPSKKQRPEQFFPRNPSVWETTVQIFQDLWNWLKNFLGMREAPTQLNFDAEL